jgi:hypothetical protein
MHIGPVGSLCSLYLGALLGRGLGDCHLVVSFRGSVAACKPLVHWARQRGYSVVFAGICADLSESRLNSAEGKFIPTGNGVAEFSDPRI